MERIQFLSLFPVIGLLVVMVRSLVMLADCIEKNGFWNLKIRHHSNPYFR
jgi:hypothetical protein